MKLFKRSLLYTDLKMYGNLSDTSIVFVVLWLLYSIKERQIIRFTKIDRLSGHY